MLGWADYLRAAIFFHLSILLIGMHEALALASFILLALSRSLCIVRQQQQHLWSLGCDASSGAARTFHCLSRDCTNLARLPPFLLYFFAST
jgi:hypothetical protein